jgi:hypothetical protein
MGATGKSKDLLNRKNLSDIQKLAKDGYTDVQIAKKIGITKSTFYEWKKKFPDFSDAIKKGKNMADEVAENSLLSSVMGYTYDEVTREPLLNSVTGEPMLDEKGGQRMVITKIVTKVAHPNTTALIFWLKNRKPEEWNDRKNKMLDIVANGEDDDI